MSIPEKEFEILDKLTNDYINKVPKVKYSLTKKIVDLSKKYGVDETKQIIQTMLQLAAFEHPCCERVQTLVNKYTPSAPYIEKSDSGKSEYVMGWYSNEQLHSVLLPICIDDGIFVNFYGFRNKKDEYLKLFAAAEPIPYIDDDGIDVSINDQSSQFGEIQIYTNTKLPIPYGLLRYT